MADDHGFSPDQRRALACVLDELVPPSEDGRMPGAGALGLADYVAARMARRPELRGLLVDGLAALDALAHGRGAREFAALPSAERAAVVLEAGTAAPELLHHLLVETYGGYYQQPAVLEALGLEARPPYPAGHPMAPSDLGRLLAGVRARPKLYRPC